MNFSRLLSRLVHSQAETHQSKDLTESEDMGMGKLLALRDVIDDIVQLGGEDTLSVDSNVNIQSVPIPVTSPSVALGQTATANATSTAAVSESTAATTTSASAANTADAATLRNTNVLPDSVQQMLLSYGDLSNKLLQMVNIPTTKATAQPTLAHSPSLNNVPPHSSTQTGATTHHMSEQVVSLKDLPYIRRRESKVQGGQIGDHSSDISYNNVCRQIEEGVKDNFTESEIVRGVLRIIKPGDFKDMLVNKEDMTVAELKGFLQSHLGERNSTELFQELICAKQNEHETPQQFLYRVIGLKQKILFSSKQSEAEMKYTPV